ncbi:Flp pilus assembly complex ATPase component TadA, partial [bacterium]|nr:Flp pilus assembly complex ATPase component TadA [bacterium]
MSDVATAQQLDIFDLLRFSVQQGASDLHMSSGSVPMIRVHGRMRKLDLPATPHSNLESITRQVLSREQLERFAEMKEIDFSARLEDIARFRVNIFQQIDGYAAVFRTIPSEIKSFDELGLPETMRELCERDRGLVLLTGPTGSGKTTTLATMIDWINEYKELHII